MPSRSRTQPGRRRRKTAGRGRAIRSFSSASSIRPCRRRAANRKRAGISNWCRRSCNRGGNRCRRRTRRCDTRSRGRPRQNAGSRGRPRRSGRRARGLRSLPDSPRGLCPGVRDKCNGYRSRRSSKLSSAAALRRAQAGNRRVRSSTLLLPGRNAARMVFSMCAYVFTQSLKRHGGVISPSRPTGLPRSVHPSRGRPGP